jgi:lipopolysaccharide/colanic/teichoic acid biosynthesis glycosyltransferase
MRASSYLRAHLLRVELRIEASVKRAIDVVGALLGIAVLSPLLATIALLIRLESPGSVLFVQERVGLGGRRFPMLKFRSMYRDAEKRRDAVVEEESTTDAFRFKSRRDPRITRVGRLLRRASLDELPQLWNVLVGHMALVGPRPPIPSETSRYTAAEWRRLDVPPGITCTWQVGGRADVSFVDQVRMDIDYIETRTLLGDVAILIATVPAVVAGRGAY